MVTALEHIVPQHLTSFVLTGKNKEMENIISVFYVRNYGLDCQMNHYT